MRRFILVFLVACSGSGSGDDGGDDDGGTDAGMTMMIDAAPTQTFPAVCDELPLVCPDAQTLATCEAGNGTAFGSCEYIPITTGCVTSGCPSDAQICRTAETSAGYCTHSCVNNDDCPIAGGGTGTCTTINGVVKICVVN